MDMDDIRKIEKNNFFFSVFSYMSIFVYGIKNAIIPDVEKVATVCYFLAITRLHTILWKYRGRESANRLPLSGLHKARSEVALLIAFKALKTREKKGHKNKQKKYDF